MPARKQKGPGTVESKVRATVANWREDAAFLPTKGASESARLRRAIVAATDEFEGEMDQPISYNWPVIELALRIGYCQGRLETLPGSKRQATEDKHVKLTLAKGTAGGPRQYEAARLLIEGLSKSEIAGRMSVTEVAVEKLWERLAEKIPGPGTARDRILSLGNGARQNAAFTWELWKAPGSPVALGVRREIAPRKKR